MADLLPKPFIQENTAQGIQGGAANPYQVGINNIDQGIIIEQDILQDMPWLISPENSWLDYQCWIETILDPGIVIHRQMPQSAQEWDQLGTNTPNSKEMANRKDGGPNLKSNGNFSDTIQRMANSQYIFVLKGAAYRAGYQPTIPKLEEVGGVLAVPVGPQKVIGPRIVGNYSGVPVYFAAWELPYSVAVPPRRSETPATNLAQHLPAVPVDQLPQGMSVPISAPDSDSLRSGPQSRIDLQTGITREAVQ